MIDRLFVLAIASAMTSSAGDGAGVEGLVSIEPLFAETLSKFETSHGNCFFRER